MNLISNQIESILTKQQLEKDYTELGSILKIAKKYGVSATPIKTRFVKYNIEFKSKNQHNQCNHNIFNEDSERSFYLAGFLAADGCIRISKTNKNSKYINNRIIISLSKKDEKHLETIRNLFDSNHKFNYYTHKLNQKSKKWKNSESVTLSITSKQMVKDLNRFNVGPRKSLTYILPKWLLKHPLKHHFIRGYIDGDGSFYKPKNSTHIVLSIRGTMSVLKTYKFLFKKECNIHIRAKPQMENGIGNFRIHSNNMVSKITSFLYKDAFIFLPRKLEKSNHIITKRN